MDPIHLEDSIHRSLRKWVSVALGSDWSVYLTREEVYEAAGPAALVESGAPTIMLGRSTVPQGDIDVTADYTVIAYPERGTLGKESAYNMNLVKSTLQAAIAIGLARDAVGATPAYSSHPFFVPLYDFTGVPITGAGRGGPDEPENQMSIGDNSVRSIPDLDDDRRFTVVANLVLKLRIGGRISTDGEVASELLPIYTP